MREGGRGGGCRNLQAPPRKGSAPHRAQPDSGNSPAEAPTPAAESHRAEPHTTPVVAGAGRPPQTGTAHRGHRILPQARAAPPPGQGPRPREGGSRGRPRPPRPHPSAPQRASPPALPSGPAFPARLSPGSARARLSPHSRRRAAGAACGPGQTPTAWGTNAGAAAPVLIPAPAFPAPRAPPAEPRLRDLAQARPEPAPVLRAPLGEEPRALASATGSRGEGPSVAGAGVPEAVPLVDGVFLPLVPRGSAFYLRRLPPPVPQPQSSEMSAIPAEESDQLLIRPL